MMPPAVTPATNPLADLVHEPTFLDIILERASVTMADLPDVLREFSRRAAYFDPSGIDRLIDISASIADSYPDLSNQARFVVVPAELWRNAVEALPISEEPAPSDLVWAEPGFRHDRAVIVPNTGGSQLRIMLYRDAPSAPTERTLAPVSFPVEPAGEPGDAPTECRLTWRVDGDYATLSCAGRCTHGDCAANRYHVVGGAEVIAGCYCG